MRYVHGDFFAVLYAAIAERKKELSLADLCNIARSIGATKYVDPSINQILDTLHQKLTDTDSFVKYIDACVNLHCPMQDIDKHLDKAEFSSSLLKILAKAEIYRDKEGKWLKVWQHFFKEHAPKLKKKMLKERNLHTRIKEFDLAKFLLISDFLQADQNYSLDLIDRETRMLIEKTCAQRNAYSYNLAKNFENHLYALALRYEKEVPFGIYCLDYVVHYG